MGLFGDIVLYIMHMSEGFKISSLLHIAYIHKWETLPQTTRACKSTIVQHLGRSNKKANIKGLHYCTLWGESTGDRWIPLTKGQ